MNFDHSYIDRIRTAYGRLTSAPGAWVMLGELREHVGGYREHVDAALRHLIRERAANVVPYAVQRRLTPYDREAAITLGGQPCHMISIH